MDRRTLIFLAVFVALVMIIMLFIGGDGGFPSQTHQLYTRELNALSSDRSTFEKTRQSVESAIKDSPELFTKSGLDKEWETQLKEAAKRLETAENELAAATEIYNTKDRERRVDLETKLHAIQAARTNAVNLANQIARTAEKRVEFKRQFSQSVARIRSNHDLIQKTTFTELQARVTAAGNDWPQKKADLDRRLAGLQAIVTSSAATYSKAEAAGAKEGGSASDADFDVVIAASNTLDLNRENLESGRKHLATLCDQLYVSWDKILADMEIKEGADVTFHHLIKTVRTKITNAAEAENGSAETDTTEQWKRVSESEFKKMEKNLGMTVAHKDAGKYDNEAETTVQPPGYSYIATKEQGRNRYGYWSHSGGSSFWVFYGQYSLMRNLFWGPSWGRGISYGDYDSYRTARRSNRTYYGGGNSRFRYGSSGTTTRSRYSGSKYARTDGFKSTQYKRSGGTYRGSRYATRSSSSSRSGGYSGSRYSSGSRSSSPFSRSTRSSSSRSFGSRFGGGK